MYLDLVKGEGPAAEDRKEADFMDSVEGEVMKNKLEFSKDEIKELT